ncbi:hypothetical protein [Thermococcus sp.]
MNPRKNLVFEEIPRGFSRLCGSDHFMSPVDIVNGRAFERKELPLELENNRDVIIGRPIEEILNLLPSVKDARTRVRAVLAEARADILGVVE